MTKELEGLKEGMKAEIHIDLLKTTEKYQIGKRQDMMEYIMQEIHLYSWQTTTRNEQMPTRSIRTRMRDHIHREESKPKNHPKQLQTHNQPTDHVENINSTNRGRDVLLVNKPQIVPRGTGMVPLRIQSHSSVTLHRSTYPKWEQDHTENISYGLIWLQKAYDMVPKGGIIKRVKMNKYHMKSYILSRKLWKPGEWNWKQEEEA